jgi:hypothetical protein
MLCEPKLVAGKSQLKMKTYIPDIHITSMCELRVENAISTQLRFSKLWVALLPGAALHFPNTAVETFSHVAFRRG